MPGVILRNQQGVRVTASNTEWVDYDVPTFKKNEVATFRFKFPNVLEKGTYFLSTNAVSQQTKQFYDWDNDAVRLYVGNKVATGGVVNPGYSVSLVK